MSNDKPKSFNIQHLGTATDSSRLRARDVEFKLQGRDVDPVVKDLMCQLAENQHYYNSRLTELASQFDQMINVMQGLANFSVEAKERIEKGMRAVREDDVEVTDTNKTDN